MKLKYIVGLAIALGFFLAGCTPSAQEQPENEVVLDGGGKIDSIQDSSQHVEGGAQVDSSQSSQTTVVLEAKNFSFGTTKISVKKGAKLVLKISNTEGTHDFVVDELGVNSGVIAQGETLEVEIPTNQIGEFEYYCSIGNHREMGMKGTLSIQE